MATETTRSQVGIFLGLALGTLALALCAIPWVDVTRHALGITGVWAEPSPYYFASLILAVVGLAAVRIVVRAKELTLWRVIALAICVLGALSAIASLGISAVISIGSAS
jgi:hypothetical protein